MSGAKDDLERAKKMLWLFENGRDVMPTGTSGTEMSEEIIKDLYAMLSKRSDSGKKSARLRTKESKAFKIFDGLAMDKMKRPHEYNAIARKRLGLEKSQVAVYLRRWKKERSGEQSSPD